MAIGERVALRFVEWVRDAPPGRLEGLRGVRARVLVEGIFRAMPRVFSSQSAGSVVAVIAWRVTDAQGGASVHTLEIRDGRCRVRRGAREEANLTIEMSLADFLRLAAGVAKGPALFATGRMRLRGDAGLALRLSLMFLIPQPRPQAPSR